MERNLQLKEGPSSIVRAFERQRRNGNGGQSGGLLRHHEDEDTGDGKHQKNVILSSDQA